MLPEPMRSLTLIALLPLSLLLASCDSGPQGIRPEAGPGGTTASAGTGRPPDGTPVVVINGESLSWDSIVAPLAEAGGGPVVEELVLTSALRREFIRRDWTLTPEDLDGERRAFEENLEALGVTGQVASAVESVRRARGLGPARFAALIERNAMLRRLVRDEIAITPEEVDLAMQLRYGPKVRARLIVVETEREASEVLARLREAGPELPARFAQEARRVSIDPTGPRGGANEPVSPSDPSLPVAMRRALEQTAVGEVSPVVALDRSFALVFPEERIGAAAVDPESARPAAEREVRLRKERIAMEEVAVRLVDSASVTVFDASLRYGWEGRRRR